MHVAFTSLVPPHRWSVGRIWSRLSGWGTAAGEGRGRRRAAATPFEDQLWTACDAAIARAATQGQDIQLSCSVSGPVCLARRAFVLEMAYELVGHAVRWGMTLHLIGRIGVEVRVQDGAAVLSVTDDGWGTRTGRACWLEFREIAALGAASGAVVKQDVGWSEAVTTVRIPAAQAPSSGQLVG